MKLDLSFLAGLFLIGSDLLARVAVQGAEQALVATRLSTVLQPWCAHRLGRELARNCVVEKDTTENDLKSLLIKNLGGIDYEFVAAYFRPKQS